MKGSKEPLLHVARVPVPVNRPPLITYGINDRAEGNAARVRVALDIF